MALSGKYEYIKEENWESHFKALGLPKTPKPDEPLEISIDGDKVAITSGSRTRNLVLNSTVEEVFGERKIQSTATLNANTLTIESTGGRHPMKVVFALSGTELVTTISGVGVGSPNAKKYYKKL